MEGRSCNHFHPHIAKVKARKVRLAFFFFFFFMHFFFFFFILALHRTHELMLSVDV